MEVLFIVVPLAIVMAGVAATAFIWSVHRGQYDDLDTPGYRALFDDALERPATTKDPSEPHGRGTKNE
jgi:cbb3-type cytochrome oxidase maturation protein